MLVARWPSALAGMVRVRHDDKRRVRTVAWQRWGRERISADKEIGAHMSRPRGLGPRLGGRGGWRGVAIAARIWHIIRNQLTKLPFQASCTQHYPGGRPTLGPSFCWFCVGEKAGVNSWVGFTDAYVRATPVLGYHHLNGSSRCSCAPQRPGMSLLAPSYKISWKNMGA